MAEMTPMMRQYLEIKQQHKDAILFFRLGDFYEMFAEDAKLASREVDLTLTTMTMELSDTSERVNGFEDMMRPYGILEVARTGLIALQKGSGKI